MTPKKPLHGRKYLRTLGFCAMNAPVNIYTAVVYDLKKKIAAELDRLNDSGQIDLDDDGYPYVVKIEQSGKNHVCHIVRNGRLENFLLNTRKKKEPIYSWNGSDGYMRRGGKKVITINSPGEDNRRERTKRSFESFTRIVKQILTG